MINDVMWETFLSEWYMAILIKTDRLSDWVKAFISRTMTAVNKNPKPKYQKFFKLNLIATFESDWLNVGNMNSIELKNYLHEKIDFEQIIS